VKTLGKTLFTLALCAFVGTMALMTKRAHAADLWQFQLTSTDAGPTEVEALRTQQQYDIWCNIPSVFKTDRLGAGTTGLGGTAVLGDGGIFMSVDVPAQVFQLPASTAALSYANWNGNGLQGGASVANIPRGRFFSGNHNGIWALAIDAGNPACNVSLVVGGQ